MKHSVMKLFAVFLYIGVLSLLEHWNLQIIFDAKLLLYFALGVILLVLCQYGRGSYSDTFLPAGAVCSFLLVFYQCYSAGNSAFSLVDFMLNLRPLFYGFLLAFACHSKELLSLDSRVKISETESVGNTTSDNSHILYFRLKEEGLTEREIEITQLIIKGLSNYAISEELYITEATVKKHITHIYEKLGIQGRKQIKEYLAVDYLSKNP